MGSPEERRRRSRGRAAFHPLTQSGFTYLEVLVAILIIGLVTPILMGGIIGSLTHARRSQDHAAATAWLQGEVDYLRGRCYDRLAPSARKITALTIQPGEPALPQGFAAAYVALEAAGDAQLKATSSLYRKDWADGAPVDPPALTTTTYIAEVRVAGSCP